MITGWLVFAIGCLLFGCTVAFWLLFSELKGGSLGNPRERRGTIAVKVCRAHEKAMGIEKKESPLSKNNLIFITEKREEIYNKFINFGVSVKYLPNGISEIIPDEEFVNFENPFEKFKNHYKKLTECINFIGDSVNQDCVRFKEGHNAFRIEETVKTVRNMNITNKKLLYRLIKDIILNEGCYGVLESANLFSISKNIERYYACIERIIFGDRGFSAYSLERFLKIMKVTGVKGTDTKRIFDVILSKLSEMKVDSKTTGKTNKIISAFEDHGLSSDLKIPISMPKNPKEVLSDPKNKSFVDFLNKKEVERMESNKSKEKECTPKEEKLMIDETKTKLAFGIKFRCGNCGDNWTEEFEKGVEIRGLLSRQDIGLHYEKNRKDIKLVCPYCGVQHDNSKLIERYTIKEHDEINMEHKETENTNSPLKEDQLIKTLETIANKLTTKEIIESEKKNDVEVYIKHLSSQEMRCDNCRGILPISDDKTMIKCSFCNEMNYVRAVFA